MHAALGRVCYLRNGQGSQVRLEGSTSRGLALGPGTGRKECGDRHFECPRKSAHASQAWILNSAFDATGIRGSEAGFAREFFLSQADSGPVVADALGE